MVHVICVRNFRGLAVCWGIHDEILLCLGQVLQLPIDRLFCLAELVVVKRLRPKKFIEINLVILVYVELLIDRLVEHLLRLRLHLFLVFRHHLQLLINVVNNVVRLISLERVGLGNQRLVDTIQ